MPSTRLKPGDPGGPALDQTLTFMKVLWRLEHALERTSKRMEDTHGVTGPQRLALRIIGVKPDIGPVELAQALHLHPSTVTGVLQRLEVAKLITRSPHAKDGRRMHLRVTRAGARLNSPSAPGTIEAAIRKALRRVSPRDRRTAIAVLTRLAT
ncbi:MAG: MarR family winged helix-turn-helix transcriptional regulator, partial [Vicinamibacterales bacterium]